MREKSNYLKLIHTIILIILIILFLLFLIRLFSPKQIDDVSPNIPCDKSYLEKSDVLYVIPSFENNNINNSSNKEWCNKILELNKTLALHGYYHNYNEFKEDKDDKYIEDSINIFKECFNQVPNDFKPPQLAISNNNKELIKRNNLTLNTRFNQITHKVYHCNDSGEFPNWIIDWI